MCARMSFKHDDYTVAWICALPLEMVLAKEVLDKVHPSLSQPETDHNVYTLGNVAGHNVVVACLPSGVYGTTSAAIVLAHMLSMFPYLRFALMVGVGGGVPSKTADICLGDVVVSMPTATSSGVIQYDHGKTLHNRRLQRTGSLNKPPQYLLTALSQAAVAYSTHNVMKLLLEKRGNQFQIIGDVVKAAAQNKENGKEILTLLLEQRGDEVQITEDVVKAAAAYSSQDVMEFLLEQRGTSFRSQKMWSRLQQGIRIMEKES
ncbi:hypothetical protein CNMCM6805_003965 [Aspergillus fumigatiaffinis]|uniref:Nucleoside phosphorylase domain-containing protein n=1 Tax=Aspergillus fumigatiaffinis TaxID=340414 RepID=A0A8H4GRQ7_9EURO|nr:hypothetical protein CNMCM5878_009872 [Aspergillus fumigatiaffinis]KAF4225089.1 hypothetical protein CNMCM6457_008658 [Aspergillus fumigatiaffinis]KAF4226865.1 hypothetical protein CNMCM6805_003965 [Aspergillus fumigatiaffinis]